LWLQRQSKGGQDDPDDGQGKAKPLVFSWQRFPAIPRHSPVLPANPLAVLDVPLASNSVPLHKGARWHVCHRDPKVAFTRIIARYSSKVSQAAI
jgi:hypothetical protein